ncbi:MAG: hypothetical protein ACYTE8_06935, partial [Planctomycetota bacterium]
PKAGTGQFTEKFSSLRDKVILWSKYSNETGAVDIPGRLYFFPLQAQEDSKSIKIKVSKYILGYWHSHEFPSVKPGEIIGKVAKTKPLTEAEKALELTIPKQINYSTGALLVDVVPVNEWVGTSNLTRQGYNDLLYSKNGQDILRMPVKSRYWAQNILNKYNEITRLEKEPRDPLRKWKEKSKLSGSRRGTGEKGKPRTLESMMQELFNQGN